MDNWDKNIAELEAFFLHAQLPDNPVRLIQIGSDMNKIPVVKITNISLFLESHFTIVKAQNGKPRYRPYLDILIELKMILTNE